MTARLTHFLRLSTQSLVHRSHHDRGRRFEIRRGHLEAPETPAEAGISVRQVEVAISLVLVGHRSVQVFWAVRFNISTDVGDQFRVV